MPLREIAGPAGRLEALLDEPMPPGAIGHDGRVSAGYPDGLRAAVVTDGARRHRFVEERFETADRAGDLTQRHGDDLR